MARTKPTLARAMAVYAVLLPILGIAAEASPQTRALPRPGPSDPPTPTDPQPPEPGPQDETVFTALSDTLTVRSLNGFTTDGLPGYFSHLGHDHDGGLVQIASPWGEQMRIRYWFTPHGVTFEYDEDLKVSYHYSSDGILDEIVAESPFGDAQMAVGDRAERFKRGELDPSSLDLSAYQVVEQAIRAKHSEAFLDGLRQTQGAIEASCATQIILCAACIIAWAGTVPAVAAACVVGGVVTFGGACIAAILAHETAGISCSVTCAEAVRECRGRPPARVVPDGCEP